jgi:hypothetical protein
VGELREKERTLRYRHLLHYIAKTELENGLVQKEMKLETEEIGKLKDMNDHLHRILHSRQQSIA